MIRREMLGLMGAGAAGLMAIGGGNARADHERGKHDEHIEMFGKCARLCAEAASHCLDALCKGEGEREAHARALEAAAGCQEFCKLTAGLIACDNPLKKYAFEGCGWACRDCAEACEKGGHDQVMKECVKMCRHCEEMCKKLHQKYGGAEGERRSTATK